LPVIDDSPAFNVDQFSLGGEWKLLTRE